MNKNFKERLMLFTIWICGLIFCGLLIVGFFYGFSFLINWADSHRPSQIENIIAGTIAILMFGALLIFFYKKAPNIFLRYLMTLLLGFVIIAIIYQMIYQKSILTIDLHHWSKHFLFTGLFFILLGFPAYGLLPSKKNIQTIIGLWSLAGLFIIMSFIK